MFVECHPRTLTEVVKHLSLIQKDQSIHDTLRIHGTNGIFAYMDGRLFIIDVGKYTSPLDPMGQFLLHIFLEQKLHDEYSIGGRLPQRKTTLDTLKFFCGFTSAGVHKRFFFPEIWCSQTVVCLWFIFVVSYYGGVLQNIKNELMLKSRNFTHQSHNSICYHFGKLTWLAGKSPFSIGNTSSKGSFSIAILVYQSGIFSFF